MSNYALVRQRINEGDEVPWVRLGDLEDIDLPRPIVLVNGAFDMLHAGHMKIIFCAREKAATLVCAVDSDAKVRKNKGVGRPIQSWVERAVALGYMPLDYIVEINTTKDMTALVAAIEPDLRVQGYDYRGMPTRYPWIKKFFVHDSGMRTSEIIRRINGITR